MALVGVRAVPRQTPTGCAPRPVPTISSRIPSDVCIPDGFTDIATDYFDDYSWRTFVALVWPAAAGHRGVPATSGIEAEGPRVFETYKSMWEVFHNDGSAPERTFGTYDTAASSPCGE